MTMEEKLFNELLASVEEAGAIKSGEKEASREIRIEAPNPDEIKSIRKCYNLTQENFSALIGISVKTLRNWEQGRRKPRGPAQVLLQVAAKHPDAVLDSVVNDYQKQSEFD